MVKIGSKMMNPYLSIVLTGRNDNYGGDFIKRLQDFFNWNCSLLEIKKVETEIVFVNWNPIENEPSILDLIGFPKNAKYVQIRIITVPSKLHESFVNSKVRRTVPIFEFLAKNVGVKRAKGEFILCLNADVLLHPKIVESIASRTLSIECYYRANRLDFKSISGAFKMHQLYKKGVFISLKGFKYSLNKALPKKLQVAYLMLFNSVRLFWELFKYRNLKFSDLFGFSVTFDNAEYYAHCLNSGDFMLMHRTHWMQYKGYPETTFVSTHTDALFTIFSHSQLKEIVFKKPIFHQEHERRYTSKLIKEDPELTKAYRDFQEISQKVLRSLYIDPYLNNDEWGLNNYSLDEIIIK